MQTALRIPSLDKVFVSTDDTTIAEIAKKWGADFPFLLPPELAADVTPNIAPLLHAMEQWSNVN